MRNPGNRIVVHYPKAGFRVRSCQTTVYPDHYVKPHAGNMQERTDRFNGWAEYVREQVAPNLDAGNRLLAEAKGILQRQSIKR